MQCEAAERSNDLAVDTPVVAAAAAAAAAPSETADSAATAPAAAAVAPSAAPAFRHPKLTSTCVAAPVVVTFQPPTLGAGFSAPTPAQLAAAKDPTAAVFPDPVTLQYSIHRVPQNMKAELRAIFPELASAPFASAALSAEQSFKALPLLAIPTFQRSSVPLVAITPEIEEEKNRLLESFYAWTKFVCERLRALGAWSDLIDPCSGYPCIGPHGTSIFSEVESAALLLAYRQESVGNCAMIDHPQWHMSQYPASMLTTATLEQTQQAIQEAMQESDRRREQAAKMAGRVWHPLAAAAR